MAKYIINDLTAEVKYLPYGLLLGLAVMLALSAVNAVRGRRGKDAVPVLPYAGFFTYLAILLCITFLSRESGSQEGIDLELLSTWGINVRNNAFVVENVLLFIPFGLVCPWAFGVLRNFLACALFGAAVSTAIECLQLVTGRGYFQIDDILTNTLGMAVGCLLYWLCVLAGKLFRRRQGIF